MTENTCKVNLTSKMAESARHKVMPESLQTRIDELTKLNFVHELHLKIKRCVSASELDVPKFDVHQFQNVNSDILATMNNHHQAIRDKVNKAANYQMRYHTTLADTLKNIHKSTI